MSARRRCLHGYGVDGCNDDHPGIAAPCSRVGIEKEDIPSIRSAVTDRSKCPITGGRRHRHEEAPPTGNADDGRTPVTGDDQAGRGIVLVRWEWVRYRGAAAEAGWSAAVLPEFPGTGPRVAQPVAARPEDPRAWRLSSSISSSFCTAFDLRKFPSRTFNATLRVGSTQCSQR